MTGWFDSTLAGRFVVTADNSGRKIPVDVWQTLERALVLSPSSYGLQPYRFLVINDPVRRAELLPHSWNQKQVMDCSHYVVFTARSKMTEADVDKLIACTNDAGNYEAKNIPGPRFPLLTKDESGPKQSAIRLNRD